MSKRSERIILPQAFVAMIPPWGNLLIELLKGTALVSLITISDLAFRAQQMNQTTFRTVEIFSLVLLFYFAIAQLMALGSNALEKKLAGAIARGARAMKLWDWNYALEILPLLARASIVTIEVTLLAFVLAATLGLALAPMRLSRLRLVAYPATAFVEVVRSTPLLIQIFFLYFVLPEFGITLGPLTVGVIALGVHYATYCAEVYRAGLENVPRGQWEATVALNMDTFHTLRDVIIPQAIPPVVPALGN